MLPWAVPCLCNAGRLALNKCHVDIDRGGNVKQSQTLSDAEA